jgi:hypothetical protein
MRKSKSGDAGKAAERQFVMSLSPRDRMKLALYLNHKNQLILKRWASIKTDDK